MTINDLKKAFPDVNNSNCAITSPATPKYNCIAWAAHKDNLFWWPDASFIYYWPPSVPRKETIDAFVAAYATENYKPCNSQNLQKDREKIAIYTLNGIPKHAARQLKNGRWTSKLGSNVDIEHELRALEGSIYGKATHFLFRKY
ncbi:MAG: hypothetical protein L0Z73_08720 [Gammaproteobacteria bacterium]|nr:hypothetical protein [Gammaproteobacteria bacterium]